MAEIWKDIKGYEGKYQVSNWGNVRSLNYNKTGQPRVMAGNINRNGYKSQMLRKGNRRKLISIHRLVAQAFIPNPNNYPCVNHKNEIKTDNRVENLEWCTYEYNTNYGGCIQKLKTNHSNRIKVKIDGSPFPSLKEAERHLGMYRGDLGKLIKRGKTTYKGHKIELIKKES